LKIGKIKRLLYSDIGTNRISEDILPECRHRFFGLANPDKINSLPIQGPKPKCTVNKIK